MRERKDKNEINIYKRIKWYFKRIIKLNGEKFYGKEDLNMILKEIILKEMNTNV